MGCLKLTYQPVLKVLPRTEQTTLSREEKSCAEAYKYKYNGKEFQDELGLNVTAMDFRNYDNAIGRFMNLDALSEMYYEHTPYNFAGSNPLLFSDPTGLNWYYQQNDGRETYQWFDGNAEIDGWENRGESTFIEFGANGKHTGSIQFLKDGSFDVVNYNDVQNAYDDTTEHHTYSNNSLFSNANIGTKAGEFSVDKWIASLGDSSQTFYTLGNGLTGGENSTGPLMGIKDRLYNVPLVGENSFMTYFGWMFANTNYSKNFADNFAHLNSLNEIFGSNSNDRLFKHLVKTYNIDSLKNINTGNDYYLKLRNAQQDTTIYRSSSVSPLLDSVTQKINSDKLNKYFFNQ